MVVGGKDMNLILSPSAYSVPAINSIDSPNSTMQDLAGLDLEGRYCYTLCNTAPELRSLLPPDPSLFQDPYCVSILSSKP